MSVQQLTELSNRYGQGEEYALAGGGNTSWKDETTLYVKASGTSLRTIRPEQFVAMDRAALGAMLQKAYPQNDDAREAAALADMMAARLPGEEHKRPSVEAILHAIFPHAYVVHTHPALVNGLTCSQNGPEECAALFGARAVWVALTKPGYILAAVCSEALQAAHAATGVFPQILLLQNHGVFVAADTPQEIDALMRDVMQTIATRMPQRPDLAAVDFDRDAACALAPALRVLFAQEQGGEGDGGAAVFCANRLTRQFVASSAAFAPLREPLTPDHIVYCKAHPLLLAAGEDPRGAFAQYCRDNGGPPKIVAVQGLGFFALGSGKKEADIARLLFLDAMKIAFFAAQAGGALALPDPFTAFIQNWEFESYRRKVALAGQAPRRLAGKIAIVTGSAQGFGKGIAEAMAAQGAALVVADRNLPGAEQCAAWLNDAHGEGTALAVAADVADELSVQAMVQQTVLAFGGLDILVANAGIAIAGGLDEMTKETFELVTAVNYTGYFLCAKHACVPMKIQRAYCPDKTMDIIEINSKSGLAGSNRNFAYAGSKFGGVGLTQSFALELVAYGIKVNAICPGNLLDGPLWSDPENGLFRQYLDAGKVPEAKTIADVRQFYEAKVPMGRGCTTDDVARAILYLVEQQYETGQALPVTGGQIMLS